MDMSWYFILAAVAVGVAVLLRFVVYTMLVKVNRWLPEKATRIANLTSTVAGALALVVIVGKAFLANH